MPRHSRTLEVLLLALVLAGAGWLRLRESSRYIVSDETRWVCRSINFRTALMAGDWAGTFQSGHPGVITMWLGSFALDAETIGHWKGLCLDETNGGENTDQLDDVGMEGVYQTLAPVIFSAHRGIAVGSLLGLFLVYLMLRAGIGLRAPPALGGLALLAFDPFLMAHSRVMHVDAMLSILALPAVLGLAAWLRHGGRGRAVVAGLLAGLAMLAKSAGFLLGPFALGIFLWRGWRDRSWRLAARDFLAWGLAAAAIYAALWPAMWTDPIGTLLRDCDEPCRAGVLVKAGDEGGHVHQSGNYFMGRPVGDPGVFFYPVAGAFRMAPLGLIGAILAFGLAMRALLECGPPRLGFPGSRARRGRASASRVASSSRRERILSSVGLLLAWAIFFALVITLGPKKFDRYLLPSLAAANLAGGLILVMLAPRLWSGLQTLLRRRGDEAGAREDDRVGDATEARHSQFGDAAALVAVLLIGLLQFAEARGARAWPYPIAYYNPLLGGARAAQDVLLMGWGEGYDLAAEYLNGLPDAENSEAASKGVANFGPLFVGRFRSAPAFRPGRTDFVVLYKSQVQRRQEPLDQLEIYHDSPERQPIFTGSINGVEMVWVYDNATLPALRETLDELIEPGDLLIAGGESVLARHWDRETPLYRYWGHWTPNDIERELLPSLPENWTRAWVVRYPGYDPPATLEVLEAQTARGPTEAIAYPDGSSVEITLFTRTPAP